MGNSEISIIAVAAVILLAIVSLLVGLSYRGVRLGMRRMRYSSRAVRATGYSVSIGIVLWLSFTGFLSFFDVVPKTYLPFVSSSFGFVIPLIGLYYVYKSQKITKIVMKMTKQWFVNIHFLRVFVELTLWFMFTDGIVPKQMTYEGYNFDLVFGLSAPFIAYRCFKSKEWPVRIALVWNVLGIISIVWYSVIALLSTEGPLLIFTNADPNRLAIQFPFIWLPTFIAPFFLFMHFVSVKQILYRTGDSSDLDLIKGSKRRRHRRKIFEE